MNISPTHREAALCSRLLSHSLIYEMVISFSLRVTLPIPLGGPGKGLKTGITSSLIARRCGDRRAEMEDWMTREDRPGRRQGGEDGYSRPT